MSQEEVLRVINAMPTESCEIDPVPTRLFKQLSPRIIKNLTELINLSLTKGIFVEDWKLATIRPLLKKIGLDLTVGNYRPVSNLMFLSKLLEKCALTQFSKHCDNNHLIPDYQSVYRQGYSCEAALLKLVNDVLWSFERGNATNFMAIDLSAAFDTLDHNILLQVLRYKFNICGKALTWFTYLHPRGCRVNVGKEYSSSRDLTCSVPQGSICGPVLYLAYASTFPEAIPNRETRGRTLDLHGCHGVKNEFKVCKTNHADENASVKVMEDCASKIKQWMDKNRLKMNDSKTEFITFASQRQYPKCNTTHLCVNGELVNRSDCIKYLGANLDQHLNFKIHVAQKFRTAMYNLYKIRQI